MHCLDGVPCKPSFVRCLNMLKPAQIHWLINGLLADTKDYMAHSASQGTARCPAVPRGPADVCLYHQRHLGKVGITFQHVLYMQPCQHVLECMQASLPLQNLACQSLHASSCKLLAFPHAALGRCLVHFKTLTPSTACIKTCRCGAVLHPG